MPDSLSEIDIILHSGRLSYGEWGRLFENKIAEYVGVNYLLATNTYSNAIYVALAGLDIKPGDEIIMSPMACLAANMPVLTYGVKIVWCDIEPSSGAISPDAVKEKISPKTKAILLNHFCGYIGYVEEIRSIADEYGLLVIEDCVEAFGSEYKGLKAGNLYADASIFSFQTVRLPNCIEGGAVCFKSQQNYDKALIARDYGIQRNLFRDVYGEISVDCDVTAYGFGAIPNEVNSYIGCKQLEDLPNLLVKQRENAKKWDEALQNDSRFTILKRKNVNPNYWVYGILARDVSHKLEIILDFRKQGFYASGVHLTNTYYSVFGNQGKFKGAEEFNNKFIAIPSGWWM